MGIAMKMLMVGVASLAVSVAHAHAADVTIRLSAALPSTGGL